MECMLSDCFTVKALVRLVENSAKPSFSLTYGCGWVRGLVDFGGRGGGGRGNMHSNSYSHVSEGKHVSL